jgi:sirohydrochlorin cobaltochelatase
VSPAWSRHCKQEDDFYKATRKGPGKAESQELWQLAPTVNQETYPGLILNLRRVETGSDCSLFSEPLCPRLCSEVHVPVPNPISYEPRVLTQIEPTIKHVLLLVGHGSRNASANRDFEELVAAYRSRNPLLSIEHCYLELAEPTLADALDACARRRQEVVILPLFLFAAGHTKNDIPLALSHARRNHPNVHFRSARTLGVHPNMVDLANERITEAISSQEKSKQTALIVVGRGSSDPDANGDFCKLVRLLGEGQSFAWVLASFIGITQPSVQETMEFVARSRPERIVVQPYFLFAGRLLQQLEIMLQDFSVRYPWIEIQLSQPLGLHEKLFALMDERVYETLENIASLPCDTCQYRVPISGVTEQVGGLKSLLYSIRHTVTHSTAMPHEHAHRPLRKHVLVCTNVECAARGSISLLIMMRRLVKKAGRSRDIRVTKTMCMGRCGEGPAVAVYPDGVWYRSVQAQDAQDLVNEHLLNDRLVSRLVDNIMQ